ncbi:MAG: SGNH/GDSL hydrolase family protein [Desulfobulbaceae bacterium]
MKAATRQWFIVAGLCCLMAVGAGLGFVAGRYSITRTFETKIEGFARAFTLGPLLTKAEKKGIGRVYRDGDGILAKLDDISWSVPNVPAPFVGNIPAPGVYPGARINSLQFRADRELPIPKPDRTFRIFLTGGSTAYGSGSPDQARTIGGYLAELLKNDLAPRTGLNYEVFTMANPAWASTHERIMIENRLSELDPDLVISFSGNNDVHWGLLGKDVFWFRTYADDFFQALIRGIYRLTDREIPEIIPPATPEDIPPPLVARKLVKNVKLSAFALAQADADYVFVLQPTLATTGKRLSGRERKYLRYMDYFRECYDRIDKDLQALHPENFTYINLADAFDQLGAQEDVFLDSYHFGDKGNEMVAQQIYSHLKEKFL